MNRISRQITKYLLLTILPYFGFAWLLLSVILFVQQASRYSDIFFNTSLPSSLIWQLTIALIPNVIAFTCPMAVLIGVIIGLSKMQGDSELTAIRAAGVGNIQVSLPIIALGIALSLFAFLINLKGVPFAAQIVRKVALETALYKLQSPIEPGTFNTDIQNFTIYVKGGDFETGNWKNVFIINKDEKQKSVRLITSTEGRIDSNNDSSEIVLKNASVNTFSVENLDEKVVTERVQEFRYAIKTKRKEIIEKMNSAEVAPEELGLKELLEYAKSKIGKDRTEAEILFQRRIILSITPFFFALLGAALVLRFNRGGKGWGIFLALVSLVVYYLIALLGEQLARKGGMSVFLSSLLPILVTSAAIFWFFLSQRLFLNKTVASVSNKRFSLPNFFQSTSRRFYIGSSLTGILNFDLLFTLVKYYLLTFAFLTVIYLVFTTFELWKFVNTATNGLSILVKYLLYLIPFIYVQIAPSALMIATLATYTIKSRQNEFVIWSAAGQSAYRLLIPCFMLMSVIGLINWTMQETFIPHYNKIQDSLRVQIRSQEKILQSKGKSWVATDNRIYSFDLGNDSIFGDDNYRKVRNLDVYQFADDNMRLISYSNVDEAIWDRGRISFLTAPKVILWNRENGGENPQNVRDLIEEYNPFKLALKKPAHLTSGEIRQIIETTDSDSEKRLYKTALQKKHTTLFLPLIITLFSAPFALSMNRKSNVITIGYAVGLWLVFIGVTNFLEQYGINGFVHPIIAVWSPLIIFTMIGLYLVSKVKT